MFSLFPATYLAFRSSPEGQTRPKFLHFVTVPQGHPNTQVLHSFRCSAIFSDGWRQTQTIAVVLSAAAKNDVSCEKDNWKDGDVN